MLPIRHRENAAPAWVRFGANYDFDFAKNRYWGAHMWLGVNTNALKYPQGLLFYNGSSAAANTLFTQWKDGIVRSEPTSQNMRVSDYGLWCEGGVGLAHNYALWCRDFTNAAWIKTTMTAAKDQIGLDGVANSASSLTATGVTDTAVQTLSFTAKLVTLSAWIKRITGTGTVSLSLDGTVWVDVSGSINSSTYTQVRLTSATTTNPIVGVQLGTNGDKIAIDFFQVENDDQATSPILTTSATNLRGVEMPSIGTPDTHYNDGLRLINFFDANQPFTILVEYSGNFSTSVAHNLYDCGGGTNSFLMTGAAGGGVITAQNNGATLVSVDSDVSGLFTINKAAFGSDGAGSAICVNGGTVTTGAARLRGTSSGGTSHIGLGNNGANALPLNGFIQRLTTFPRFLAATEFKTYTTL